MAAGATYEPISTTTLGSAVTSFNFNSIPSTYTDLRLVLVATANSTQIYPRFQVNSDTGTNYSFTRLRGDGTTASSAANTSQTAVGILWDGGATSTRPSLGTVDLFSYAGSTNKTFLITGSSDQNGSGWVERISRIVTGKQINCS